MPDLLHLIKQLLKGSILILPAFILWSCSPARHEKQDSFQPEDTLTETSTPDSITLLFVGDLMQHRAQIDTAHARSLHEGYDYTDYFGEVQSRIAAADLSIGNLETTIGGKPYTGYPAFSAPDEWLQTLQHAGFDILLTANNHCLDRGKRGVERTLMMLDSLKFLHTGTYRHAKERSIHYPLLIERKGFRIVLLNYTYGTNGLAPHHPNIVNYINRDTIRQDLQAAKALKPDILIACMHWGTEYQSVPDSNQYELTKWLFQEGVSHIIGSHPHVVQPMELRKGPVGEKQLVVYSLGNFTSNMSAPNTDGGLLIELTFTKGNKGSATQLSHCDYRFVWTARPVLSGFSNFRLFYADTNHPLPAPAETRRNQFYKAATTLFQKYNKGFASE